MLFVGIRVKFKRKGVRKMKTSVSLMFNVLVASMLFLFVPTAPGQDLGSGAILKVPAEAGAYCHMKFPAMLEDSLSWTHPGFDDGTVSTVDFYGSCDHDPFGIDEIKTERRVRLRGIYGDGE
jgi:hypothetical protein